MDTARFQEAAAVPCSPQQNNLDHRDELALGQSMDGSVHLSSKDYFDLLAIKKKIDPGNKYVGQSLPMLGVFKKIKTFNRSPDEPILIFGPIGSGKSEIAELIHDASGRNPFYRDQAGNNRAADFNVTKADWAGHGEGSGFPNVPKDGRPGILTNLAGGTIFLDEIQHASPLFQIFLLDVIEGKPIPVAGGTAPPVTPNVRFIFATNENLEEAVKRGDFRRDLLARINTRVLEIPALADRKDDIVSFVEAQCNEYRPSSSFLLCLLEYGWPGNVRELIKVLGLAMDEAGDTKKLKLDHLSALHDRALVDRIHRIPETVAELRVFRMLMNMLKRQGWKEGYGLQSQLAKLMGVSQSTITRRARQYRLSADSRVA